MLSATLTAASAVALCKWRSNFTEAQFTTELVNYAPLHVHNTHQNVLTAPATHHIWAPSQLLKGVTLYQMPSVFPSMGGLSVSCPSFGRNAASATHSNDPSSCRFKT
jgi:hypothetical protein